MHASRKCAILFINVIFLCLMETQGYFGHIIQKTNSVQARKRSTREAGYVYDRPTISFNLPSRDIPVISSTQASPIDRTPMQMYYAYPAPPRGPSVSVGMSAATPGYRSGSQGGGAISRGNTGPSATAEYEAYNYGAPNEVSGNRRESFSQTNQQASSLITSGGNLNSGGYSYDSQIIPRRANDGVSTQRGYRVNIANDSGGYNSIAPDVAEIDRSQANRRVSLTNVVSSIDTGTSGYSYGIQMNTVKASSENTGPDSSSGSTGYNYKKQSTVTSQTALQEYTTLSTIRSTGIDSISKSAGYDYQIPKENTGTSSTSDTSGYSYKSPVQSTTTSPVSVSTNAPQYLPPISNTNKVKLSNILSSGADVTQSDVYLPPKVNNILTATQTTSNVKPETNIVPSESYLPPQSSNAALTKPSPTTIPVAEPEVYLPPESPNPSEGIETTSTLIQPLQNNNIITSDLNLPLNPKNTYLQPSSPPVSSSPKTSLTVSSQPQIVPSTNYLPSVPTSREINQLVSTPAATYLPPVL